MENLCKLSEKILDAFGVDEMISYVCSLSDDKILQIINKDLG